MVLKVKPDGELEEEVELSQESGGEIVEIIVLLFVWLVAQYLHYCNNELCNKDSAENFYTPWWLLTLPGNFNFVQT